MFLEASEEVLNDGSGRGRKYFELNYIQNYDTVSSNETSDESPNVQNGEKSPGVVVDRNSILKSISENIQAQSKHYRKKLRKFLSNVIFYA